jgi:nucleotide-binding universal stress UspA family protein
MSIVLGYDSSPAARSALDTAIGLATRLNETLVLVYGAGVPGGPSEEMSAQREAIEELGSKALGSAVERARAAGLEPVVQLLAEKPTDALLSAAETHNALFIVVGTAGESPVRAAVLGAVGHRLLQRSTRPVLCVPAVKKP